MSRSGAPSTTVIHEQPGYTDHRAKTGVPFDDMYAPVHRIDFTPDGEFAKLFGKTSTMINSLHWQGIDRVSDRLIVEGRAPDGVGRSGAREGRRIRARRASGIRNSEPPRIRIRCGCSRPSARLHSPAPLREKAAPRRRPSPQIGPDLSAQFCVRSPESPGIRRLEHAWRVLLTCKHTASVGVNLGVSTSSNRTLAVAAVATAAVTGKRSPPPRTDSDNGV